MRYICPRLKNTKQNPKGEDMKIYREIVRNTAMGAQSIDNILCYIDCEKMKNLALSQKETMEEFYQKAKSELSEKELEDAQTNPVQRIMLKAGVKMNAGLNNSCSHLASMLIDGYNMGIESVQKMHKRVESRRSRRSRPCKRPYESLRQKHQGVACVLVTFRTCMQSLPHSKTPQTSAMHCTLST